MDGSAAAPPSADSSASGFGSPSVDRGQRERERETVITVVRDTRSVCVWMVYSSGGLIGAGGGLFRALVAPLYSGSQTDEPAALGGSAD